jgi:hypothetical protein
MSISDSILKSRSKQQPVEQLTGPPLAGPGSGHTPAHLPGVIKARDAYKEFCADLPAFLQRSQFRQYLGSIATSIGSTYNYGYALADAVPQGRYWVVTYASVVLVTSGSEGFPGLWMLPPGIRPAGNNAPYQDNPLVFADTEPSAGEVANGGPILQGIRVDDADYVSMADGNGLKPGAESVMLRTRMLIVPQNWSLMAWGGGAGFGNGGAEPEQFKLNILFSEFLLNEDTEVR